MLKLIQISVQMLRRQLVICADHGAFKQAPDALYGVCVNIAAYCIGIVSVNVMKLPNGNGRCQPNELQFFKAKRATKEQFNHFTR